MLSLEKRQAYLNLLGIYHGGLRQSQEVVLRQYLEEDLSLREIASLAGVSHNAIHTRIRAGLQALDRFEARLSVAKHLQQLEVALADHPQQLGLLYQLFYQIEQEENENGL